MLPLLLLILAAVAPAAGPIITCTERVLADGSRTSFIYYMLVLSPRRISSSRSTHRAGPCTSQVPYPVRLE